MAKIISTHNIIKLFSPVHKCWLAIYGYLGLAGTSLWHWTWLPEPLPSFSFSPSAYPSQFLTAHLGFQEIQHLLHPDVGAAEFCHLSQAWVPSLPSTHRWETRENTRMRTSLASLLVFSKGLISKEGRWGTQQGFILQGPRYGSWIYTKAPCWGAQSEGTSCGPIRSPNVERVLTHDLIRLTYGCRMVARAELPNTESV